MTYQKLYIKQRNKCVLVMSSSFSCILNTNYKRKSSKQLEVSHCLQITTSNFLSLLPATWHLVQMSYKTWSTFESNNGSVWMYTESDTVWYWRLTFKNNDNTVWIATHLNTKPNWAKDRVHGFQSTIQIALREIKQLKYNVCYNRR